MSTPSRPRPEFVPACCTPTTDASVAEKLYCLYNAGGDPDTAGLNYEGKSCPVWVDLPPNVRAKWEAVAAAISQGSSI